LPGALLAALQGGAHCDVGRLAHCRDEVVAHVAHHLLTIARLHQINASFTAKGIRFAALKGPVLSEHVYPDPSWRSYGDLDLLVAPSDAVAARDALLALGARIVPGQDEIHDHGLDGEIALELPGPVYIDLHHDLINDAKVRAGFSVPTGELLMRTRTVDIGGQLVPTFDATDQLLHLCLHAALSDGRRFVWLLDIDQAVRRDPPDWARLVIRAERWRTGLATAVMLERARSMFGTPITDRLLDQLASGSAWPALCRALARVRPVSMGSSAILAGGVVIASTRSSSAGSLRALMASGWRKGVVAPLQNPDHPWRQHPRPGT
jgi:hypothetical protein